MALRWLALCLWLLPPGLPAEVLVVYRCQGVAGEMRFSDTPLPDCAGPVTRVELALQAGVANEQSAPDYQAIEAMARRLREDRLAAEREALEQRLLRQRLAAEAARREVGENASADGEQRLIWLPYLPQARGSVARPGAGILPTPRPDIDTARRPPAGSSTPWRAVNEPTR